MPNLPPPPPPLHHHHHRHNHRHHHHHQNPGSFAHFLLALHPPATRVTPMRGRRRHVLPRGHSGVGLGLRHHLALAKPRNRRSTSGNICKQGRNGRDS